MKKYPVVLLPSHRSYLDFLLVSYFLYEFNMQLPVIAAAQGIECVPSQSNLLSYTYSNKSLKAILKLQAGKH